MRMRNISKQIGLRAGVGKRENEYVCFDVIEQKPVILDVAVAKSFQVAGKRMF